MIGRLALAAVWLLLWRGAVSAEVVEFVGGDRVEGTLKEATPAAVIVEVAGQSIRFETGKVRAIYFRSPVPTPSPGTTTPAPTQAPAATAPAQSPVAAPAAPPAPPATSAAPSTSAAPALSLLQSLRSAVANGIGLREYEAQVSYLTPLVTLYVAASPPPPGAEAIRDAMRYYVLAESAWENQGILSRTVWLKRDEALARCAAYESFAREMQDKGEAYYAERMRSYLEISDGVIPVLWSCAADRIAEAEKLTVAAKP